MNERIILGCKVNDITKEQASKMVRDFLLGTKTRSIVTPNPEMCLKAYYNYDLQNIIKYADIALPDGIGLKLGARIQGQHLENIVTGVDFSEELFRLASELRQRVLLIGGKGKTGTRALENIRERYPHLTVEYLNGGVFSSDGVSEYPDYIDRINSFAPDIILVNLGVPKQEFFIERHKHLLKTCKVIIGVGGTIDFLSGRVKRAPLWMRSIGIEWLWRLGLEPWRWRRILNAVVAFPLHCILWKIRNAWVYRRGVVALIYNKEKKLLLAKRKSRFEDRDFKDHWQLPQGGIDRGEDLQAAALREIEEELGIKEHLHVIEVCKDCYSYTWTSHAKLFMPYKGQKQSIFLMYFDGTDDDIHIDQKEFTEYRWVDRHHILQLAHEYRRPVIAKALEMFNKHQ